MNDDGHANYIAHRADETLSYGDIAYAQSQGWCSSSPDGMGPHRPDDTTDPVTCAECGATIDLPDEAQVGLNSDELRLIANLVGQNYVAEVRLVDDCAPSLALLGKVNKALADMGSQS